MEKKRVTARPTKTRATFRGVLRTVALVLLIGNVKPNVKAKAELYLNTHLDTYPDKDVPQHQHRPTTATDNTVSDVITYLTAVVGGGTGTTRRSRSIKGYLQVIPFLEC